MGVSKTTNPQKKWNPPSLPLEAFPWKRNGHHWHLIHTWFWSCYTYVCASSLLSTVQRNKQLRSTKRFSANMFVEVAVKLDSLHFPECQVPTRKTTLTKKTALAHAQETRSEPKPQTPMHSTQGRGVDISAEERNREGTPVSFYWAGNTVSSALWVAVSFPKTSNPSSNKHPAPRRKVLNPTRQKHLKQKLRKNPSNKITASLGWIITPFSHTNGNITPPLSPRSHPCSLWWNGLAHTAQAFSEDSLSFLFENLVSFTNDDPVVLRDNLLD